MKQKPDNITGLECRFSDSFNSEFSYIGYNHDGQKPGLYDYLMEIRKNGNLLFSKVLSPYYADVELDFPNGTYDLTVSPAYENELYNEQSNFTLIINNETIERISLVYKTGN